MCIRDSFSSLPFPKLVAVSKKQEEQKIELAIRSGQKIFGENRVQEALQRWQKRIEMYKDIELRLIGPLQTNKVKQALKLFNIIETIDREKLAREIAKNFNHESKTKSFYIQVNTGSETQKSGLIPTDVDAFIAANPSASIMEAVGGALAGCGTISSTATAHMQAYVDSIDAFQTAGGIMVFAAGNDNSDSDVSALAALPIWFSQLSEAYITVAYMEVRGSPTISGSNFFQLSNPCQQMAENCLVADAWEIFGAYWHDDSSSTSNYTDITGGGSSSASPMVSGIIALSISESAFQAEIFRAGINSIKKSQWEAGSSLGLSFFRKLRLVILPQAIKNILPAIGNQFVYVLKMSSLVSVSYTHLTLPTIYSV